MKVRCIKADGAPALEEGAVYTVATAQAPYYTLDMEYYEGVKWYQDRFEIVKETAVSTLDKLKESGKAPAENPKAAFGGKKPRLTLIPLVGQLAQLEAQLDGALKYGEVNWREVSVQYKTYADAALRHLQLAINGEDLARDTKVQNLGAVMACCAILLDAEAHGTMVDNRDHSPAACDALHNAENMVAHLKRMQEERDMPAPPQFAPPVYPRDATDL